MELPTGRELDALVAEKVMGYSWQLWETGMGLYDPSGNKVAKRFKTEGMKLQICDIMGSECVPTRPLPEFSSDIRAALEVEEELKRRNLAHHYVSMLQKEVNEVEASNGFVGTHSDLFALIHATPLERCRAALKTVMLPKDHP